MRRRRELSQNFLRDLSYAEKMVTLLAPEKSDTVVEVGPGEGIISKLLAGRCIKLLLIEKDRLLVEKLQEEFSSLSHVKILCADALKTPLREILSDPALLISNLPFSITSEFLIYLVENRALIKRAVITFQKEVAERILSAPGEKTYSWQSVWMQSFFKVERGFNIPPSAFHPRPKVTSTVLRLIPREDRLSVEKTSGFLSFLRHVFSGRKRKLSSVLPSHIKEKIENRELLEQRVYRIQAEDYFSFFYRA